MTYETQELEPIEAVDQVTDLDDDTEAPAVVEPQEAAPEWSEDDAEEARAFGWKAPDEWGGEKPPTYVGDPRAYMERIQNSKPFKVMAERQEKLDAEYAERARKMDAVYAKVIEQQRTKYDADLADIAKQQRRAVELADTAKFDELETRKAGLVAPASEPEPAVTGDPYVQEYAKENDWVNNPILRQAGAQIIDANPAARAMNAKDQIAYAEQEVRKLYPGAFAEPEAPKPATPAPRQRVDGGGLGSGGGGGREPFNALPTEAKAAFKRFVAEGIFENTPEGRKAYVTDYNG